MLMELYALLWCAEYIHFQFVKLVDPKQSTGVLAICARFFAVTRAIAYIHKRREILSLERLTNFVTGALETQVRFTTCLESLYYLGY
jgi:hypothetical protein